MAVNDEDIEGLFCSNPDCRVAETGRCVEGFQLEACPHYGSEADEAEAEDDSLEEPNGRENVTLPSAGTLSLSDVSGILRQGDARVVAILGPSDSGKTSLIAGLYDLFQEGAVEAVEFGRSRTLHAFEQTCHDARAASRRGVPHMNRTPFGEVSFYHLGLGGGHAGAGLALLLGDRAGEEYRAASDDASVAAGFAEIARADSLTVLVDGERMLDVGSRHNLRSNIMMMLQGIEDGGVLRPGVRLAVVLTKLDALRGDEREERASRDFDILLDDVRRIFGHLFAAIEPFRIAASPKTNALGRGTGLSNLLAFWLEPAALVQQPISVPRTSGRMFARLMPRDEPAEVPHV